MLKAVFKHWRNTKDIYYNYLIIEPLTSRIGTKGYLVQSRIVDGESQKTGWKDYWAPEREFIIIEDFQIFNYKDYAKLMRDK